MKRLLCLISFMLSIVVMFCQSAEGRYSSRLTRDGVLFFIMPERLRDVSGIKSFEYDMTLLSWSDSVTVNFTFESPEMTIPSDFAIISGEEEAVCHSFSPLFVDIKRNHFEIRITSKFSVSEIKSMIYSTFPPRFRFMQGAEAKSATYKPKQWAKDRKKLNDIFQLYLLSK